MRPPHILPNHDLDIALLGKTELTELLVCEALLAVLWPRVRKAVPAVFDDEHKLQKF